MVVSVAIILLIIFAACCSEAASWDPYYELAHPEGWGQPKPGRSMMFAGTDPGGGNVDSGNFLRIEPEGASFQEGDWVLAEMEGPGAITRIWVTGKDKNNKGPRIFGRIKIYIDSRDKPEIDLPIEDFFGRVEPFVQPLATPTSGGWINYLPIPFSSYCKVVVTDHQDRFAHRVNGLKQTIPHLYHQINWRKLPAGTEVEPFSMKLSEERQERLWTAQEKLKPGYGRMLTSGDVIAPGETKSFFATDGPGTVKEFSLSCPQVERLRVRIYWDGASEPAVDAPARMFFAAGAEPRPFNSLPFSLNAGTYTCRFPMPYAKSAKITLENTGDKPVETSVSIICDSRMPPSDLRFHAKYIDQDLKAGSPDLVVIDAKRGPGHFVGCALTLPHDFLEGNESFIVDGKKPEWTGTGTEDYFNGGWYFCFGPYDHAFSGCTHKGDYVSAYRFHLLDAVPYEKSLMMKLEHGAANESAGLARGVAYWYQSSGD